MSDLLPPAARRAVFWLATALSAALLALSAWFCWQLLLNQLGNGMKSYALGLPIWYYSVALPFGFALVLIRYLQYAIRGADLGA